MPASLFLAQLLGVFFIIIALAILTNPSRIKSVMAEILKNPALFYLGGIINLLCGLLILLHHNIWEANWQMLISIVGAMMTLKGILLLLAPNSMQRLAKYMYEQEFYRFGAFLMLVLGGFLYYMGFFSNFIAKA